MLFIRNIKAIALLHFECFMLAIILHSILCSAMPSVRCRWPNGFAAFDFYVFRLSRALKICKIQKLFGKLLILINLTVIKTVVFPLYKLSIFGSRLIQKGCTTRGPKHPTLSVLPVSGKSGQAGQLINSHKKQFQRPIVWKNQLCIE